MKKRISLIATAALLVMQACSFEEVKIEPDIPQVDPYKVQIHADITQQPATRVAVDDGFCVGDVVGVYLVNYDGENPGTLKLEDNQADNVKFSFDENGNWISEYDIYYKDNETNVDFYAYYPYTEPTSIEAYPFEVARDQSKGPEHGQLGTYEASDFLWAKKENVTPTASKVMLTFRHKMASARIRFSQGTGWDDAAEYAAVTKDVLVTNTIRKSTVNLATGVVTPVGEAPLTGIVPMNDNGDYRAIVVPQVVEAGKTVLTLTIGGHPRHYVRDVATEYIPGKMTTFDMTISKKANTGEFEVELTGVNITAWEADNVSHGDDAREYVVVHNEIPGQLLFLIEERLEMDPTKIKNLKITGKLNSVDFSCFYRMTSLMRINLKEAECLNGLNTYAMPSSAFTGMKSLMKCVLPDKLDIIYQGTFEGSSLTGAVILPEGLKEVSGFKGTNITSVHFPSTLEVIGDNAFADCSSLLSEISLPESLKKIGASAFYRSNIKGNLSLPHNLETIGERAFYNCSNLTGSLIVPEKITVLPDYAFYLSGFNGTLTLPDGLQDIGADAFNCCPLKGELSIPETVKNIGRSAFANTTFTNVKLPSDLISLGERTFNGCWRLSGIITIPKNILAVPSGAFEDCENLDGIILHKEVNVIGSRAFADCYFLSSIVCEAKNPPSISYDTFNGVAKDNFTLEVPESSVILYKNASTWSEFKRIAAHRDFSINRSLFRTLNDKHSKSFVLRASADEHWSVESKPEWVTVQPMSGTGKTDVVVTTLDLEHGSGNRSGEIVFLLDDKEYRSTMQVEQYDYQYGDGDLITLQEASVGNGVNIVLMGDCFDAKDISEGHYLQGIQEAYRYFFDIEPYLTYKDYFNVYGVFGMSADSGIGTVNTIREARFGTQYSVSRGEMNARVAPDFNATFAAACIAPISNDVSTTLIIMVENSSEYEGVCYMWGDGSAVALVPMSTDPAPYDFRGLVHHEAGGHGFGKLADEYISHNDFISSCQCGCCDHGEVLEEMKSCGFYENVSVTGNMHDVPWAHMIFDPQYSNIVDVYEGAYLHTRGVYRSEPKSCMVNNIPYYNAISRETIVKKIKKYAGEEYSFEGFKSKDKESMPSVTTKSDWAYSEDNCSMYRRGHAIPVLVGEKPEFEL